VQLDNKYHEAKSNIEDELDKPNAEVDKEALNGALTEFNEVAVTLPPSPPAAHSPHMRQVIEMYIKGKESKESIEDPW